MIKRCYWFVWGFMVGLLGMMVFMSGGGVVCEDLLEFDLLVLIIDDFR